MAEAEFPALLVQAEIERWSIATNFTVKMHTIWQIAGNLAIVKSDDRLHYGLQEENHLAGI